MKEIDIGDICLIGGHDTGWGSGSFVNRIPCGGWDRSQLHENFQAVFANEPADAQYEGYACAECYYANCDWCVDERNGKTIDITDYIDVRVDLCPEHVGTYYCKHCNAPVDAWYEYELDGDEFVHVGCPELARA